MSRTGISLTPAFSASGSLAVSSSPASARTRPVSSSIRSAAEIAADQLFGGELDLRARCSISLRARRGGHLGAGLGQRSPVLASIRSATSFWPRMRSGRTGSSSPGRIAS